MHINSLDSLEEKDYLGLCKLRTLLQLVFGSFCGVSGSDCLPGSGSDFVGGEESTAAFDICSLQINSTLRPWAQR
jgi:hypothetical protein